MDKKTANALAEFYASPMGKMVRRLILRRLASLYPPQSSPASDARISAGPISAGMGYARPYMPWLARHFSRQIILQFGGYPPRAWPEGKASRLAEVNEATMPLLASSLDHVLLVHGLELAPAPSALLDEIWRLLKGGGRLSLIVPHRRARWASCEHTPFGQGQPFSPKQVRQLLESQGFHVHLMRSALALPPYSAPFYTRFAPLTERISYRFGGVLVVEAEKMLYAVRPLADKAWNRAGQGARRGAGRTASAYEES